MSANSTAVHSNQPGIHEHLAALVARHAASPYRKPIADYNRAAFDLAIAGWRAAGQAPLILDAGCGVGMSTLFLARRYPDHFVVGVDQSADRIGRNRQWDGPLPENCMRLRADMVDFWRLLLEAGIKPARQYVLYPNPWPKKGQLARRWHGHPVFPAVVELGGVFECRSNWKTYIDECAAALEQLGAGPVTAQPFSPGRQHGSQDESHDGTITPFERKYLLSGHGLWRCRVDLDAFAQRFHAGNRQTA
jgi:tRNA (guanine-N7-)-methyltransferase